MSTVLVHLSFWPTLYYLVFLWRCNERESNSMPLFNISLIPILLQGFSKTKFCENFVILGKNVMRCDFFHAFVLSRIWHLFRGGILFSIILGVQCVSVRMTLHHLLKSSNTSCKNFRNSRIVRCSWIQFANMISLNHRYYIYSTRMMIFVKCL